MSELIAKPIVKDQYWVVTDGEKKVGNVQANGSGFTLQLNGKDTIYKNTDDIKKTAKIRFEPLKSNKIKANMPYPEYPTTQRIYNSIFDIRKKLHLFTKSKNSKCYHVAGWFILEQNGQKQVSFCPKYIFIQRYTYDGPYKSEDEANSRINTSDVTY